MSRAPACVALRALALATLPALALATLLALALARPALADGDFAERLERADGWLAEQATWPRAVDTYRALLAEAPERHEVRLRLARVLSWDGRYDEALAEYDRVLAEVPDHPTAAVERAEVLSWAGRGPQADAAFAEILAAEPENARALRGRARVHLWEGDRTAADRWFRRSLALEEDPDARREWRALRSEIAPTAESRSAWYVDDADFELIESWLEGSAWSDFHTRFYARVGWLQLDRGPGEDRPGVRRDRGLDLAFGAERQLRDDLRGGLELGGRSWRLEGSRPYLRSHLAWSPDERTSLQLLLSNEEHLTQLGSRQTVADDTHGTYGQLGLWRALDPHFSFYGNVQSGWLSDGNELLGSYAELAFEPRPEGRTSFGLGGSLVRYADESANYYAPELDVTAMLRATHRRELGAAVHLEAEAFLGYGLAREGGVEGTGPSYSARVALEWTPDPWVLGLELRGGRSQRSIAYDSGHVAIELRRTF